MTITTFQLYIFVVVVAAAGDVAGTYFVSCDEILSTARMFHTRLQRSSIQGKFMFNKSISLPSGKSYDIELQTLTWCFYLTCLHDDCHHIYSLLQLLLYPKLNYKLHLPLGPLSQIFYKP
jgi:hypothetical protein